MKYRLGFDFGYTSLGWACVLLDDENEPCDIHDFGVRIFPSGRDAKSNEPLSVTRRDKRGARRNRDRYLARRERLLKLMTELGLQPADSKERKLLSELEPLVIRAKAVTEKVSLYELGRALFHINQRRGFKSNRIADRSEKSVAEAEKGLKKGISYLQTQLKENQQTLGQFLYQRACDGLPTRLKADNDQYEIWTSRQMYSDEFDSILNKQKKYYENILTQQNIDNLHNEIFYQRNLKPKEAGFCTFVDGEHRARLACPEVQQFRIYQELANLQINKEDIDTPQLTNEHKQKIANYLINDFTELNKRGNELTWAKIQTITGIKGVKYNLDTSGRKGLKADSTTRFMTEALGDIWLNMNSEQQHSLIDILQTTQSTAELVAKIDEFKQKYQINITTDTVTQLEKINLVDGYGSLSLAAIEKILPFLKQGLLYNEACAEAGFNHSDNRGDEVFDASLENPLPYYGEVLPKAVIGGNYKDKDDIKKNPETYFGKINNPTVHIALNQFKRVLNELVERYGTPPESIHTEVAREATMSAKQMAEHNREQAQNRKKNEEIDEVLEKLNIATNYANRMKYKLWEDLDKDPTGRCCPLSGKSISMEQLFSSEVEVEHIIPYSRSFDDGRNNKMLCFKSANQLKGKKTPYEAYSDKPEQYDQIIARAKKMDNEKSKTRKFWRFLPDAIDKFKNDDKAAFLARMLNDTKYMTRIALQYAEAATKFGNKNKDKVVAIKGKYTSQLRHHWQLEQFVNDESSKKDRNCHHHHAIDALTVALSGISTMQKMERANKRSLASESEKLFAKLEKPYPHFDSEGINKIKERLKTLVISHKSDHKNPQIAKQTGNTIGALHEDTNYGHIIENIYATRKELTADNFDKIKNILEIASNNIREQIEYIFGNYSDATGKLIDKKGYEADLAEFKKQNNIKKVRIHLPKDNLIAIKDKEGNAYRHVVGGNNYCAEIWCSNKGKKAGIWQSEIIQNHFVNQKDFMPQWRVENPTAYKVMRLQINDMLAIVRDGARVICRVQKMDAGGTIILRSHNDSQTNPKTQIATVASSLQKQNARKLFVSPAGKIYDPGKAKQAKG